MNIDDLIYYKLRGYNDSDVLYGNNFKTKIILLHSYQAKEYNCKNLFIIVNEDGTLITNTSEITYYNFSKKNLTFRTIYLTININDFKNYFEIIKLFRIQLNKLNIWRHNKINLDKTKLIKKITNGCGYYLKYLTHMINYLKYSDKTIFNYQDFNIINEDDVISIVNLIKNNFNQYYDKLHNVEKECLNELLKLNNIINLDIEILNKILYFEKQLYLDYKNDYNSYYDKYFFINNDIKNKIIDDHSKTMSEYPLILDF